MLNERFVNLSRLLPYTHLTEDGRWRRQARGSRRFTFGIVHRVALCFLFNTDARSSIAETLQARLTNRVGRRDDRGGEYIREKPFGTASRPERAGTARALSHLLHCVT